MMDTKQRTEPQVDFDHQHPFRLVFTGADHETDFTLLPDLVEWRNYQVLPDYDFLVLKVGHHDMLRTTNYHELLRLFEANPHLNQKPVRFSVFASVPTTQPSIDLSTTHDVQCLTKFVHEMRKLNPNFTASVAWVFDCLENDPHDLSCLPEQPKDLSYNLYLHHLHEVEDSFALLMEHAHRFNGLDITSYLNNFEAPQFALDNRAIVVQLLEKLLADGEMGRGILERLCPEYATWVSKENTFKSDIQNFCKDGFLVNGQGISPLVYGSFDDFTLHGKDGLSVPDFLLMTFEQVYEHWLKAWSRKVITSHCFSCDMFTACQSKSYYWVNLDAKGCALGLDKILPIRLIQ